MKTFVLATAAAIVLVAPAQAADMPVKAPPLVAAAIYNWTGFYIGGTVGLVFGNHSYSNPNGFNSATNDIPSKVIGGPTVGFNWQNGRLLLGVEGDYSWSKARSIDLSGCGPPGCLTEFPWFATARGRIGYAHDNILFYVTGGAAWARQELTFLPTGGNNGRKTIAGWAAGGGVEMGFWQNWSAKVEYLRLNFGDQTIFNPLIATNIVHHDQNINMLRVGLNYRFGGPVVARY